MPPGDTVRDAPASNEGALLSSAPIQLAERRRRRVSPVELVERAQGGDRDSFEQLYRMQFDGIARQVAALVRDPHRTEDVVAQTFLLAWRDLPKLRRPDRFDSWLARIAHNQAMSELRRRAVARLEDAPDPEDPREREQPATAIELNENLEEVRAALLEIPDDQRQVLLLRFIRELSHAETARLLGRSEEATRALQYRALRSMQRILEADRA